MQESKPKESILVPGISSEEEPRVLQTDTPGEDKIDKTNSEDQSLFSTLSEKVSNESPEKQTILAEDTNSDEHNKEETPIDEVEKRKLRRQELLERQRKASEDESNKPWKAKLEEKTLDSSKDPSKTSMQENSEGFDPPKSSKIRESFVENAIKFLNDPKVTNHPVEKKRIFLESKGLHPAEINLAFDRAVPQVTSKTKQLNSGPPLPPRQYKFIPPKPIILPRPPLTFIWKQLGLIVFSLASGGCLFAFLFKKFAIPVLVKIFRGRQYLLNSRKTQFVQFQEDCKDQEERCQQFILEKKERNKRGFYRENTLEEIGICEKPIPLLMDEGEKIKKQVHSLDAYRNKIVGRTSSLAREISGLFTYYFHQVPDPSGDPMFWNRSDSPAAGVKSDIRALKGILLRSNSRPRLGQD